MAARTPEREALTQPIFHPETDPSSFLNTKTSKEIDATTKKTRKPQHQSSIRALLYFGVSFIALSVACKYSFTPALDEGAGAYLFEDEAGHDQYNFVDSNSAGDQNGSSPGAIQEAKAGNPAPPPSAGEKPAAQVEQDIENEEEDLPEDMKPLGITDLDHIDQPATFSAEFVFPSFKDVSRKMSISDTEADKTSPPSIADLNQDGWMDIVISNHAREDLEIFYGSAKGGFRRTTFFWKKQDRHGTAVADYDGDGMVDILLTIGGTNGLVPAVPVIGKTSANGTLQRLEAEDVGIDKRTMRGVAARFMDMDGDGDLDLFILSRPPLVGGPAHSVYENVGNGMFELRPSTGIEQGKNVGFQVTDYDSDGIPDIILVGASFEIWKGDGKFNFRKVNSEVLPKEQDQEFHIAVSGITEIDYDNDGDFDIYVAGGARGKKEYNPYDDILLENVGGTFIDVSAASQIPKGGVHNGITVGDFNNDGFVDIFVPREGPGDDRIPDLILLNNGNKTFTTVSDHGANGPPHQSQASGGQAFDYNRDGRVDVVVGSRRNPDGGRLFLFENISPATGNYITVDLPVNNEFGDSSMDAIVTVEAGGKVFTRKAGSVGECRTQSYIDSVHFGLGGIQAVDRIDVKLSSGRTYALDTVQEINREIQIGAASLHRK